MFKKEILEEGIGTDEVKNRRHPRIDTFFKADFKYLLDHNGVISGRATIINLSEGGMFAEQVLAMDAMTEDIFVPGKIASHELYDMEFSLGENSELIETRGVCIREFREEGKLCAGIHFREMKQEHKEIIRDYVRSSAKQPAWPPVRMARQGRCLSG